MSKTNSRPIRSCGCSEDPEDLRDIATRAGGRYMGRERAEDYGRRNDVPGELVVRLHPTKVLAAFDLAE